MTSNITSKFVCEKCNYNCNKKGDFNRHLLTAKHKRLMETNNYIKNTSYDCVCGKSYKHQSSLSKHKKTCKNKNPDETLISLFKIQQEQNNKIIENQQEQNNKIIENQQELQQKNIDLIGFIFKRLDNIEERLKNLENK